MHLGPSLRLSCFSLDVTNTFNLISKGVIFQKFRTIGGDIIQFIPFNHAFKFPLFYNHCNCGDDATIIPFAMGPCHSDLLGGPLFVLTHFRALHSIASHFPSYLFPSITDDIHIIGPF